MLMMTQVGSLHRRLAVFFVAIVFAAIPSSALAELKYYEPFLIGPNPAAGQYTVGLLDPSVSPGDGQNPTGTPATFLAGSWEATDSTAPNGAVQNTSLTYLGSPSAGGSQISTPNSNQRRFLPVPWTSTTVGTFYVGFEINYGQGNYADGIDGNDMGYRAVELWNETNGFAMGISYNTFSSRIGPLQQDPRTARMFADFSGVGGGDVIIENSPLSFMEDGLTHLVVLRFNLSDQPASDSILVYLDPNSSTEPDLPGPSISNIDFTLGAMSGVRIFGGSGTFPIYDELRVATTFVEAIPELPLPGDANSDGDVDIDDFNIITANLNLSGPMVPGDIAGADGRQGADGRVDLRDLSLWRRHRTDIAGAGSGSTSLADGIVPEPGTALLLAIGAAVYLLMRTGGRCVG
jgi:hypothetical protein